MDALVVKVNNISQVAAELQPESTTSLTLIWVVGAKKGFKLDIARYTEIGKDFWDLKPLEIGDEISVLTSKVQKVDTPVESLSSEEWYALLNREPKKIGPLKVANAEPHLKGVISCQINEGYLCKFDVKRGDLFTVQYSWIGNSSGHSEVRISLGDSKPKSPNFQFGDELRINSGVEALSDH